MSVAVSINDETNTSFNFDRLTFIKVALDLKYVSEGSIDFTFVDDDYMISLHKTYLNDATQTDIITFNLESSIKPLGDIYICVDEVKRNADHLKTSFENEIKHLILHGILHLIGYTDYNPFEKTYMIDEQTRLITLIQQSEVQ
ncbi:rRNA maturation RNase YbeY [bacterium]|nr:rRNA maturation RNase YbeY [bacterium]